MGRIFCVGVEQDVCLGSMTEGRRYMKLVLVEWGDGGVGCGVGGSGNHQEEWARNQRLKVKGWRLGLVHWIGND